MSDRAGIRGLTPNVHTYTPNTSELRTWLLYPGKPPQFAGLPTRATRKRGQQCRVAGSCRDLKCSLSNQIVEAPLGGLQQTGVHPAATSNHALQAVSKLHPSSVCCSSRAQDAARLPEEAVKWHFWKHWITPLSAASDGLCCSVESSQRTISTVWSPASAQLYLRPVNGQISAAFTICS